MSSSPLSSDAALPRAGFGFIFALAGATLMMAGAAAPTLFYPVLQQQIGFSPAMISAIFAIYAVALLASLLVFGSLSDHVGRRIALTVGFGGLAVAVVAFWHANSVATLLSARVVQGLATGILMPALSAVAVDLEPRSRPGSAAIWSAVLPLCGLAGGAFGSGLAMKYGLSPKPEVFGTLAVLYVVLMMLTWALPETSPRHEGVLRALRPRVGLPEAAKPTFWRSAPAVFAGWAIGGLYLSLGTGIVSRVFQPSPKPVSSCCWPAPARCPSSWPGARTSGRCFWWVRPRWPWARCCRCWACRCRRCRSTWRGSRSAVWALGPVSTAPSAA